MQRQKLTIADLAGRTLYHVAPSSWQSGDPLVCYNILESIGAAPDWRWNHSPLEGDADMVCFCNTLDAAREFRAEYQPGGIILAVTFPPAHEWPDQYRLPWEGAGYITPEPYRVEEGYLAVSEGVPAEWLTIVEEVR